MLAYPPIKFYLLVYPQAHHQIAIIPPMLHHHFHHLFLERCLQPAAFFFHFYTLFAMLSLEDEFPSLEATRKVILIYTVEYGKSFTISKADYKHYIIICQDSSCQFRIQASALKDSIQITVFIPHSCSPLVY